MSEDQNLPATQEQARPPSQAEQQRARMDFLVKQVESRGEQLVTLLKGSGISLDRFVEVFRRAMIKGAEKEATNLLLADAGSVIQACIDACTAGVLPDGKRGAIVIYNTNVAQRGEQKRWIKRAQFLVMYEGMLQIAYASGNFQSIAAQVVYETDEWDYELGISPWIKHKPGPRPPRPEGPPYAVVAAYAVAKTVNGGVFVEVFEPEDIRKVMAVSRATSGPAKDWPEQMARKGPLRRLWKFLPRDSRMDRVLEVDDESFDLDIAPVEAAPPKSLKVGFGAPAIEHTPAQTADIPMEQVRDEEPAGEFEEDARFHATESAGTMYAGEPGVFGTTDEPAYNSRSPRIHEFADRVAAAQSWLNIKQALRGLMKAQDWDRAADEGQALSIAWARFTELGDKTDFVLDSLLFACWLEGKDPVPTPDEITGNLRVLETQADWGRSGEEIQDWITRRVREKVGA